MTLWTPLDSTVIVLSTNGGYVICFALLWNQAKSYLFFLQCKVILNLHAFGKSTPPSSCHVIVSPVAFVLPRRRAACRSAARCRRHVARRHAAPCHHCAARRLVARRRRCATSSYRPSPFLCCPSPCSPLPSLCPSSLFCPLPSSCFPSPSPCRVLSPVALSCRVMRTVKSTTAMQCANVLTWELNRFRGQTTDDGR